MTYAVYVAGPDGVHREFADEAAAAEWRRAYRDAEPPLLKLLREYRGDVLALQQRADRALGDRHGRTEAFRDIESALRGLRNRMLDEINKAACESYAAFEAVKDLHERSAPVWGLGTVRVRRCEHQQEPQHFQFFADGVIRATCPHCCVVTMQIELDTEELGHDEA